MRHSRSLSLKVQNSERPRSLDDVRTVNFEQYRYGVLDQNFRRFMTPCMTVLVVVLNSTYYEIFLLRVHF